MDATESNSIPTQLEALCEIVVDVARKMSLADRSCTLDLDTKEDGSYVLQIDRDMQKMLGEALRARWPECSMLGEEMAFEEQARVLRDADNAQSSDDADNGDDYRGVWCIDPVDGTTNFYFGFPFYSVSVGLLDRDGPRAGVVYDPIRDECFAAQRGVGAWLNGRVLKTTGDMELRQCMACVDYKRLVTRLSERLVRSAPFRSQRHLGSSALEWCWLASNRIQVYVHGGQKLWDYSAGVLILREAGGAACTLEGTELRCNTLTKRSVVAATSQSLLAAWFQWVEQNMRHG